MSCRARPLPLLAMVAALGLASSLIKADEPNGVRVVNRSEPGICAEKDNVAVEFHGPQVRRFKVIAEHPAYIGTLASDRSAPDFTACDMTGDPAFAAQARKVTLWESADYWLVGYAYPSFWRPGNVPVRVGSRAEQGLHLLQLWTRQGERVEEVLVLYPPDGYWRARPLAFGQLRSTAYGSSFLVGPVEEQGRPVVVLQEVAFDPATLTFSLRFARGGGTGTVRVEKLDSDHLAMAISLPAGLPGDLPFAALRSMYATETNADAARVAWRARGAAGWGEDSVLRFQSADEVTAFWLGRVVPSRHNTSAPDMVLNGFEPAARE